MMGSGCAIGMRSDVFLTAMMPATLATPSTSPFLAVPSWIAFSVSGETTMLPLAVAVRDVTAFPETSTMMALPCSSK